MNKKSEIGKLGEDLACEYLISKGYKICERNFRKPWGELDIITKDPEDILVFVEVKTIRQSSWQAMRQFGNAAIQPEENLTAAKLTKLKRIASLYAGFNEDKIDDEKGWQIDLIAITIPDVTAEELTDLVKYCEIKHFENI